MYVLLMYRLLKILLSNISRPWVCVDSHLFGGEFRAWMSEITGIEFTDRVDLSCSKYEYTGTTEYLFMFSLFF